MTGAFVYLIGLGSFVLTVSFGIVRGLKWLCELDNDVEI